MVKWAISAFIIKRWYESPHAYPPSPSRLFFPPESISFGPSGLRIILLLPRPFRWHQKLAFEPFRSVSQSATTVVFAAFTHLAMVGDALVMTSVM